MPGGIIGRTASIGGLVGLLALGGCYYGPAYGPGPGRVVAGGPYDVYYDGFYGPFYDGYWAGGGFYYRRGIGGPWQRDWGGHFGHRPVPGFHGVRFVHGPR